MNARNDTFYITTAIDYPNSVPHMGHAYEKVVADFYVRIARLRGQDARLLIGLDEHGQKIQEAAKAVEQEPRQFVDEKAKVFRDLYRRLEISSDDFIRTSEERHHEFVRELYGRVLDQGDIYEGVYQADYCISCEKALTKSELVDGRCPIHDRPTSPIEEPSYFFRLGKYRERMRDHIRAHPEFVVPEERRNEVLARLDEEVLDLSISRSTFDWGIPLPNDPDHVLYVWFDALSNYISALRRPEDLFDRYWPADCHVIGKDILWFHTVIWPAMLLSAGIELPRQVYVHGFILDRDGRKMAKHLGNVIDPLQVIEEYSVDVLRFYFLRAFASGQDGRFSLEDLCERYHSELGNDLGNLILRVAKLATTRLGAEVAPGDEVADLGAREAVDRYLAACDRREHHRAVEALWALIRRANAYLNEREPWKIREEGPLREVLHSTLETLRVALHLLSPVMPRCAETAAASIGAPIGRLEDLWSGDRTYRVSLGEPLFPRRDRPDDPAKGKGKGEEGGKGKGRAERRPGKMESESPDRGRSAGGAEPIDPFAKLEIRVGRIVEVEEHPDAENLFAMRVDVGEEEPRSICAGLRAHLGRGDLEDRKVLVLANLKPARLRGIESRGMVLASDRRDGVVVPVDPGEAEPGELVTAEGIEPRPKKKLSSKDLEKAPLEIRGGRVVYRDVPLRTSAGDVTCDAEDGATVR